MNESTHFGRDAQLASPRFLNMGFNSNSNLKIKILTLIRHHMLLSVLKIVVQCPVVY